MARERMEAQDFGRNPCSPEQRLTGPARDESGYTRNVVGRALGTSGPSYQRAKFVVEAAGDEDGAGGGSLLVFSRCRA